jgi:dTDP-4-amino-4,6-dideoxygalactose transaminase
MILTDNYEYYEKLKLFRTHGITKDKHCLEKNDGDWYYEMHALGYNYRITDIQCALGISQLKKLDYFIKRRREIVERYNEAFAGMDEIITPYEAPWVKSAYHLYMILLNLDYLKAGRKQIFDALRAEKIGVHVHYIPLHLQPYYKKALGYKEGDFPVAENYYARALTLPLFPRMTDDNAEDVIKAVKKVIRYYS